jgi:hypothetical protein
MSSSKKSLPVFICLRPRTPYPLSHTVYVYTVYLFTRERGEGAWGELHHRDRERGNSSLGRKYQHDLLYLQSINSDKHLPQSPFTGQIFYMTTFCFVVYIVN